MQVVDKPCQHSREVNGGITDIGKIVGSYIESEDLRGHHVHTNIRRDNWVAKNIFGHARDSTSTQRVSKRSKRMKPSIVFKPIADSQSGIIRGLKRTRTRRTLKESDSVRKTIGF